jgi:hypothetical protein
MTLYSGGIPPAPCLPVGRRQRVKPSNNNHTICGLWFDFKEKIKQVQMILEKKIGLPDFQEPI